MTALSHVVTDLGDQLTIANHRLFFEQVDVVAAAKDFGTPLHMISESQIRGNYRRLFSAFSSRWQEGVTIHYSIKANPALALRRILSEEGAGGDCLEVNELRASLLGGANPENLVLNGNNKTPAAIRLAVCHGVRINIDHADEWNEVAAAAKEFRRRPRVGLRIKPALTEFGSELSELRPTAIKDYGNSNKWGMPLDVTSRVATRLKEAEVDLEGIHYHLGRQIGHPRLFEMLIRSVVRFMKGVTENTGWQPPALNLGGGFTQGRDPFAWRLREEEGWPSALVRTAPDITDYAQAIVSVLKSELHRERLHRPSLEFECGRFLMANAGITVTQVGLIKRIGDRIWVNVDLPTSHVGMMRSPHNAHALVSASRPGTGGNERFDVVGPLCTADVLCQGVQGPEVHEGDYLALLDTGAYVEGEATSTNLLPRPAVVLVRQHGVEVIRRRETFEDLIARDRMPTWFTDGAGIGEAIT